MTLACHAVLRENDKWIICACGKRVIACRDRRTALKTARRAAELLAREEAGGAGGATADAGHPRAPRLPTDEDAPALKQAG